MSQHTEKVIQIWRSSDAPQHLQLLSGAAGAKWVTQIPPDLASPEVEALFTQRETGTGAIQSHRLADGSVVLYDSVE